MIRCVRLWTGADGKSRFEEGVVELAREARGHALSGALPINAASFRETDVDPKLGWHPDAVQATQLQCKERHDDPLCASMDRRGQ